MGLLLALLLAAPAPKATPPTAHWTSDWGEQRCSLVRETGGTASKTMMVRSVPGTEQVELWWIDPLWQGPKLAAYTRVKILLKPSGTEINGYAYGLRVLGQTGLLVDNLEDPFLRTFGESNAIQVSAGNRMLIDLPLPMANKALAALRECEDDRLRSWGLDPKVVRASRAPVKQVQSAAAWVYDSDYPDEAIRAGVSGSVLTRLKVGPDGLVSDCLVVESSGHPVLDETTCRILRTRGRFHPALDAEGKPTAGLTAIRIRWILPSG